MSLKLYAPGTRKANKTYVAYGWWAGKPYERSLDTRDPEEAQTRFLELQVNLRRMRATGGDFSYADADAQYRTVKQIEPNSTEAKVLDAILRAIGQDTAAATITSVMLQTAALKLYPRAKGATRNRQVIVPASSVLHLASEEGRIPWQRYKKFQEDAPEPRAIKREQALALINSAKDLQQRAFLLFLFKHGWRIGEVLRLRWKDLDFAERTVLRHITKTNEWKVLPLQDEVAKAILDAVPERQRFGRVFTWGNGSNVRRWLNPLCKKLGFYFTPHMARHSFATWAVNDGVSLPELMEAGGWKDVKSVQRYGRVDRERVRAVLNRPSRGTSRDG